MGLTGMSGEKVEACLTDQSILDKVSEVMETGKSYGVDSTPTFFINGEEHKGALTIDQFSEIIDPMISAAQ
jgi:protein-disulfide isomerase